MLRLLTGDPPELAAQALEVFRGAEEGRYTLAVHPLAVAEAFYTLVSFYGVGRAEAAGALSDLLDREGVLLEDEEDLRPALEEAGKGGLSLVDAFLAQRARRQGAGLATLDFGPQAAKAGRGRATSLGFGLFLARGYPPRTPAFPSPGPGWKGSAGSTGCEAGGTQLGSQQAKAGPEGRARRKSQAKSKSQKTLPLMPPGPHSAPPLLQQVISPGPQEAHR
ncbi:hypothetical protein, partial [Thermus arciformis]|uniref:hypothetical protein n=1 Tax=Thermus arciformis TaxID=482827 RepID=UPI001F4A21BC